MDTTFETIHDLLSPGTKLALEASHPQDCSGILLPLNLPPARRFSCSNDAADLLIEDLRNSFDLMYDGRDPDNEILYYRKGPSRYPQRIKCSLDMVSTAHLMLKLCLLNIGGIITLAQLQSARRKQTGGKVSLDSTYQYRCALKRELGGHFTSRLITKGKRKRYGVNDHGISILVVERNENPHSKGDSQTDESQ